MPPSITPRASATAWLLLLADVGFACRDGQPPHDPAREARIVTAPDTSRQEAATIDASATSSQRLIEVTAFECEKSGTLPGDTIGNAIAPGAGISDWNSGGPSGAVWNAFDLHCVVQVRTSCADGSVLTELRVGRSAVASAAHPIAGRPTLTWSVVIPDGKWERHLDERSPSKKYFITGVFRAMAFLTCREPFQAVPGLGAPPASRTFVAGFASGE